VGSPARLRADGSPRISGIEASSRKPGIYAGGGVEMAEKLQHPEPVDFIFDTAAPLED